VPRKAVIRGLQILIVPTAVPALGDYCVAEVSLAAAGQPITNDAQNVIGRAAVSAGMLTSGVVPAANVYIGPTAVDILQGARIYLHAAETGTCTYQVHVVLHLDM
jgi:hypothetical protein